MSSPMVAGTAPLVNHEGRHDGPWTYRMVQVPWKVVEAVAEAAGALGTADSEIANRLHST